MDHKPIKAINPYVQDMWPKEYLFAPDVNSINPLGSFGSLSCGFFPLPGK